MLLLWYNALDFCDGKNAFLHEMSGLVAPKFRACRETQKVSAEGRCGSESCMFVYERGVCVDLREGLVWIRVFYAYVHEENLCGNIFP